MEIKTPNLVETTFFCIEERVHHLREIISLMKKSEAHPVAVKCLNDNCDAILEYCNRLSQHLTECDELGMTPNQREQLINDFESKNKVPSIDLNKIFSAGSEIGDKDVSSNG